VEIGEIPLTEKVSIVITVNSYEGEDEDGEPSAGEPKLVIAKRIRTAKKGDKYKPVGRMTESEASAVLKVLTAYDMKKVFAEARKNLET
jgi:hypothetical protein